MPTYAWIELDSLKACPFLSRLGPDGASLLLRPLHASFHSAATWHWQARRAAMSPFLWKMFERMEYCGKPMR